MEKLNLEKYVNLPEDIIKKIISYADDLNDFRCHTCLKKISSIEKYIKIGYFKFCSELCFRCC